MSIFGSLNKLIYHCITNFCQIDSLKQLIFCHSFVNWLPSAWWFSFWRLSCFCSGSWWGWSHLKACLGHPGWLLHSHDLHFNWVGWSGICPFLWPLYEPGLSFLTAWWSKVNFKWLLVSPITRALRDRGRSYKAFLWSRLRYYKSSPLLYSIC